MRSERIRRNVRTHEVGEMGNWALWCPDHDSPTYELWHYSTLMLVWTEDRAGKCYATYTSIGIGSVTDQQVMNAVFEELRIPLRYRRDGGNPRIEAA